MPMYPLPDFAQAHLNTVLAEVPHKTLLAACQALSASYRSQTASEETATHLRSPTAVAAYLATRLPATYAVMCQVWQRLREVAPDYQPRSLLDLGAGPGTATLAASQCFDSLQSLHLLEAHPQMLAAGRELFRAGPARLQAARWQRGNLTQPQASSAEVACLAYVLNELPAHTWPRLFAELAAQHELLVWVEPGTPQGYAQLLQVRQTFVAWGWQIWAPCPHQLACPLQDPDWCHFSQRLERSALHRQLKAAQHNHEDEKFAYLILGKLPAPAPAASRILRHPQHHKGHIGFTLCTPTGQAQQVLGKKEPDWRQLKSRVWGDALR